MKAFSRRKGRNVIDALIRLFAGAAVVCLADAAATAGLAKGPPKNSAGSAHYLKTLANADSNSTAATAAPVAVVECTESARCQLEMGKAFGDPWVKAEAGKVNYFEVRWAILPTVLL